MVQPISLGLSVRSSSIGRAAPALRQLPARRPYAGLGPTPWQSGSVGHEQGVSKAGNPRLWRTMVELAWLWLRNQPGSTLARRL